METTNTLKFPHVGFQKIPLKLKPMGYVSPLSLKPAKRGEYEVKTPTIKEKSLPIIGFRQALTRGIEPVSLALPPKGLKIHQLVGPTGLWMTDMPEELFQIAEMLAKVNPRGRVLVGGLGLGILPKVLMTREGVTKVTVVEISPEVIELCKDPKAGYEVVQDDIKHYLETSDEQFDYILLDTWQGTNEGTWWNTVMPLKRICRHRWPKAKFWGWAEDIMAGQVGRSLILNKQHWYYTNIHELSKDQARRFIENVGKPGWEKAYKDRLWDASREAA